TPLYIYSASTILDHYTRLDAALAPLDHLICYAVKANSNRAILKLLADAGAGFDIVSGGELFRAIKSGADPKKITFAGVGKARDEIEYALEQGVHSFNVESEAELELIDKIADAKKARARKRRRQMVARSRGRTVRFQHPRLCKCDRAAAARSRCPCPGGTRPLSRWQRRHLAHSRSLHQIRRRTDSPWRKIRSEKIRD